VRGMTPVVTYPATAVSKRVLSGVASITSPVRNISLVANIVGIGMQNYALPAYDACVGPVREKMQAISIKVSCSYQRNGSAGCCMCITDCKCTLHACGHIALSANLFAVTFCAGSL